MGACIGIKRKDIEVIPQKRRIFKPLNKSDIETDRKTPRYLVCKPGIEPFSLKTQQGPVLMDPKENPLFASHKRKLSV